MDTASMIVKTVNFHGQQLSKIMEDKQLKLLGSINIRDVDYHEYQQRAKDLSMQDRTKRLKLLNFMADKAELLYRPLSNEELPQRYNSVIEDEDLYGKVPSMPEFLGLNRAAWREQTLKVVRPGQIILSTVVGLKPTGALVLDCAVLISHGCLPMARNQQHIRAVVPVPSGNHLWKPHELCMGLVLEVQQGDMIVMSLNEADLPPHLSGSVRLGHVTLSELTPRCRRAVSNQEPQSSYEDHLHAAIGFHNPNAMQFLAERQGVLDDKNSLALHLGNGFPKEECAAGLRKEQASRWAYRSVAKGVALFKKGDYSEAFQCLNQALNVDPTNVEGLVARGALFANRGNYEKAILDFEKALGEDPNHQNAKKYMGETLVAQAKSYEDEKDHDKALEVYKLSLSFLPENKEALRSIRFLKAMKVGQIQTEDLLRLDDLTIPQRSEKTSELKKKLLALLGEDEEAGSSSSKKKKKSKKRRRRSSSGSSSSSSSSSSRSDGSRSRGSSRGSRASRSRSRRRSRSKSKRQSGSLSPLSKKMHLMQEGQLPLAPGGPSEPLVHAFNNPPPTAPPLAEQVPMGANPYQMYPSNMPSGSHPLPPMPPFYNVPPPMKTHEDHAYEEKVRRFLDSLEKDGGSGPRKDRQPEPVRAREHRDYRDQWDARDPRDYRDQRDPLEMYMDRGRRRDSDRDRFHGPGRERGRSPERHRSRSDRDRERDESKDTPRAAKDSKGSKDTKDSKSSKESRNRKGSKEREKEGKSSKDSKEGKSSKSTKENRDEEKKHKRERKDSAKDKDETTPAKKARDEDRHKKKDKDEGSAKKRDKKKSDWEDDKDDKDDPSKTDSKSKSEKKSKPPPMAEPESKPRPAVEPEPALAAPAEDDEFLYDGDARDAIMDAVKPPPSVTGDNYDPSDPTQDEDTTAAAAGMRSSAREDTAGQHKSGGKRERQGSGGGGSDSTAAAAPGPDSKYLTELEQLRKQVQKLKEKQEKKKKKKKKEKEKARSRSMSSSSGHSPEPRWSARDGSPDGKQHRSQERVVRMESTNSDEANNKWRQSGWCDENVEVKKRKDGTVRIVKTEVDERDGPRDSVSKMKAVFEEYQTADRAAETKAKLKGFTVGKRPDLKINLMGTKKKLPSPEPLPPGTEPPPPGTESPENTSVVQQQQQQPSAAGRSDGPSGRRRRSRSRSHSRSRSRSRSRTRSRSRFRSRSRTRSRSRSRGRRPRSRSRSRSRRRRRSYSRSRSRSRRRRRSRSRSRSRGRRSRSRSRSRGRRRSYSPLMAYQDATFRTAGHYVPGRFSKAYRAGYRGSFRGNLKMENRGRGARGGFRGGFHGGGDDRFHFVKRSSRSPPGRLRQGEKATADMFAKLKEAKLKIEADLSAKLAPEEVEKLMAGKWASNDSGGAGASTADAKAESLEATEKFIAKGMAEKKKEMLERNKHLLKNASGP